MVKACLWKYAFIFPSITIDIDSDDRIGDSSIFSSDLTSSTSDSLYRREIYLTIKSKNDSTINYLKEQIMIAAGTPISGVLYFPEKMHAIECRVNAEDPLNNFAPSPGKITALHTPKGYGVRVDTHIYAGYTVPPYYDSLLAKVICRAKSREECIVKMKRALEEFIIEGVKTTIPFHIVLMDNEEFRSGKFDTGLLERFDYVSAIKELE